MRTTDTAKMIGLTGSEDEEDAVEEDLDDDIDCMYDAADVGDHVQLENADDEHSETGESTDEEKNVFQGKDFTGAGHLPTSLEQDTSSNGVTLAAGSDVTRKQT